MLANKDSSNRLADSDVRNAKDLASKSVLTVNMSSTYLEAIN